MDHLARVGRVVHRCCYGHGLGLGHGTLTMAWIVDVVGVFVLPEEYDRRCAIHVCASTDPRTGRRVPTPGRAGRGANRDQHGPSPSFPPAARCQTWRRLSLGFRWLPWFRWPRRPRWRNRDLDLHLGSSVEWVAEHEYSATGHRRRPITPRHRATIGFMAAGFPASLERPGGPIIGWSCDSSSGS